MLTKDDRPPSFRRTSGPAREIRRPRPRHDGREPDFQAGYVIGTSEALTAASASVRAVGEAPADAIAMAYLDAPTRSGSRKNRGAEAVAMRDAIVDVVAGLADELDAWAQRPDAEPIASSARSAAEATLLDLEVGVTTRGGRGHPPGGGGRHTFALRGYLGVPSAILCCLLWRWLFLGKASK